MNTVAAFVAIGLVALATVAGAVVAVVKFATRLIAAQEEKFASLLAAEREAAEGRVEALRHEFAALAAKELASGNAQRLTPILERMKEEFASFKEATATARKENAVLGEALKARIDEVGAASQSLGRQADEFVTALRGGSKAQGVWGEGILTRVLADAGLKEGEHFKLQTGTREAGLPDVTIFDGEHRKILVDSKVNITSFIEACNASRDGDEEAAKRLMREHARSVRAQIQGLAERDYPVRMKNSDKDPDSEYSPVVIMFMPSEATYAAAITADPTLVAFANAKGIVIATPQMLFGYLVLFKMGLDRLQADRKTAEMLRKATLVCERVEASFATFEEVGKALDKAQAKYHETMRKMGLEPGAMNVLTPARELARMAGKQL